MGLIGYGFRHLDDLVFLQQAGSDGASSPEVARPRGLSAGVARPGETSPPHRMDLLGGCSLMESAPCKVNDVLFEGCSFCAVAAQYETIIIHAG